jgi:hypothetical protein
MFKLPRKYAIKSEDFGSNDEIFNNGVFSILFESFVINVIASAGLGIRFRLPEKPHPELARDVLVSQTQARVIRPESLAALAAWEAVPRGALLILARQVCDQVFDRLVFA